MQAINTNQAPPAIGPYSQAVLSNGVLYISGQLGIDPVSGNMAEGFEEQANRVFANLKAILEAAGRGQGILPAGRHRSVERRQAAGLVGR